MAVPQIAPGTVVILQNLPPHWLGLNAIEQAILDLKDHIRVTCAKPSLTSYGPSELPTNSTPQKNAGTLLGHTVMLLAHV